MQPMAVEVEILESDELQSNIDEATMAPVVKSMTVDIDNLEPDKFVDEIEKLRVELGVRYVLNRPVLTPVIPDSDPHLPKLIRFFDIKLVSSKSEVTLRVRTDTLYFQGYQIQCGKWFELGDKHLIDQKSLLLKMGENYTELLRAAGYDFTAGLTALGPPGYSRLQDAASWLADETIPLRDGTGDIKKRATCLLMLIVMFCETARSIPTLEYLKGKFWANLREDTSRIPAGVDKLAHIWGSSSHLIIQNEKNPCLKLSANDTVDLNIEDQHVTAKTICELTTIFGILQDNPKKPKEEGGEIEEELIEEF